MKPPNEISRPQDSPETAAHDTAEPITAHGFLKPFIPSWLDDAGLSQSAFRLYCHLCRRADNQTGVAWPSYTSIQAACGFSHKTVWRVVKELETLGLIAKVGKPFGGSCRYQILTPTGADKTPIAIVSPGESLDGSNHVTRGTVEAPMVSPGESLQPLQSFPSGNINRSPQETPILSPGEREGDPRKEIQGRKSNSEFFAADEILPFDSEEFREAWKEWQQHRRETKKKLTDTARKKQLKKIAEWGEHRSIAYIECSIRNGWEGIFPDREYQPLTGKATHAEVVAYAKEYGVTTNLADIFFDKSDKADWKDRNGPIQDWQAAFREFVGWRDPGVAEPAKIKKPIQFID